MNNFVNPLYLFDNNLTSCKTIVTKTGTSVINKKAYNWLQLRETIFHPKGGGQLNDSGTIQGTPIAYVHKEIIDKSRFDQFEIFHCFASDSKINFSEGEEVDLIIDGSLRQLYSRMHTAGHLIASVTQTIFPFLSPFHGNHDPEDGYVKFKILPQNILDTEIIKNAIQTELGYQISSNLDVAIINLPSGLREVKIGNNSMPCGGTHVDCLKQIGVIEIKSISINNKEQTITIKYVVKEE